MRLIKKTFFKLLKKLKQTIQQLHYSISTLKEFWFWIYIGIFVLWFCLHFLSAHCSSFPPFEVICFVLFFVGKKIWKLLNVGGSLMMKKHIVPLQINCVQTGRGSNLKDWNWKKKRREQSTAQHSKAKHAIIE